MFSNINIKKVALWLFVIMVGSFIIAGSIVFTKGFNATIFGGNKNTTVQNVNAEKSFNAVSVSDIEINDVSTDISLIPVDSNEIKAHLYGSVTSDSDNILPELEATQNGNTLNVNIKLKQNNSFSINFQNNQLKLDVYIPKSYSKNIMVTSVSGKLKVENLNLDRFSFNSTSGDLIAITTTAKITTLKTTSGKMSLNNFKGDLDFNSVSGDIIVDYAAFNNNIKTYSVSGSTKIKLPENSQFNFNFSSVSGDFKSNFPANNYSSTGKHNFETSVGKSDNTISIKSVSGDTEINK